MSNIKASDTFPEGVSFSYIAPTGELDLTACGRVIQYDASKEAKDKKIVIVAVPGAFTPTCQEKHFTSYLANLDKFKAAGVDQIIFIATNDAFVMSAWGKANGIKDESILFMCDNGGKFSKSVGWNQGDRTQRFAILVDHGKVVYADVETERGSIEKSGAEAVLARL